MRAGPAAAPGSDPRPAAAPHAGRERGVLCLGLAALGVGLGAGLLTLLGAKLGFPEVPERRIALCIASLAGLAAGALLVLLRRRIAAHLVPLLAAGVALGLALTTLLLGDLFMSYRALTRAKPGESIDRLHVPDERLGWLPRPSHVARHRRAGNFDVEYRIDGESFREVPFEGSPARQLWLFGDSFTFGLGVGNEDVYANRIARDYLSARVRVINAGVSGHGLVQMYARLLGLRDRLRPGDVVVFALISEDLQRNLNDFVFLSQFLFGPLGADGLHFPGYRDGRLESVRIDGFGRRLGALFFHAPLTEHLHRFAYRAITGSTQRSMREARAVLADARALCAARDVGFALVFLPRVKELARGRYEVDVSRFDFIDIRRFFPDDEAGRAALRFPDDAHWTPRGHEIAAGALVAVLRERGLLGVEDLQRGALLPRP